MKKPIRSYISVILQSAPFRKSILSIIIGGILGFLYFYFVGCRAGSCSITSDPYGSIVTGGLLGFFIGGEIKSKKGNTNNQSTDES